MEFKSEIDRLNPGDPDINRDCVVDRDGNVYNIPITTTPNNFSDYMSGLLDEPPEDDYRDLSP